MKVNVLKKSKGFLKVEVEGEGHTFGHLMQNALLEDKTVDWAGYDLPHPLFTKPTITVRMKGEASAEKALERAAKKVHQDTEEFIEKFTAAVSAEAES
jgi:DNA-directed RNA polymerase subunit L